MKLSEIPTIGIFLSTAEQILIADSGVGKMFCGRYFKAKMAWPNPLLKCDDFKLLGLNTAL